MDYILVGIAAFGASGLTLFSGFGLGTLLLPVFAVFFPIELAVSLTAVVHLANNLFKLILFGKHADRKIVTRFGIPAILAAFFGAWCLSLFADAKLVTSYIILGAVAEVTLIKLLMSGLMMFFVFAEIFSSFKDLSFGEKYLPLGGGISGFFGGFSGHQGAFRSIFLLKCGLSKESYIGTGVVIACFVDVARLAIYSSRFTRAVESEYIPFAAIAVISAFAGSWLGNRFIKKTTIQSMRILVSALMLLIAAGLGLGVI